MNQFDVKVLISFDVLKASTNGHSREKRWLTNDCQRKNCYYRFGCAYSRLSAVSTSSAGGLTQDIIPIGSATPTPPPRYWICNSGPICEWYNVRCCA